MLTSIIVWVRIWAFCILRRHWTDARCSTVREGKSQDHSRQSCGVLSFSRQQHLYICNYMSYIIAMDDNRTKYTVGNDVPTQDLPT